MKIFGKASLAILFAAALFPRGARAGARPSEGNALDEESANCVSCHDSFESAHHRLSVCSVNDECDHPIGGDYMRLSSRGSSIRPAANLDSAIRLHDGRFSCTTCHVPYVDAENHQKLINLRKIYPIVPDPMLVVDNRHRQLCHACHIK